MAESALATVTGSAVAVDPMTWSAIAWTGTHIGSFGQQVSVVVSQIGPQDIRFTCCSRPRCPTTRVTFGVGRRKVERLVEVLN